MTVATVALAAVATLNGAFVTPGAAREPLLADLRGLGVETVVLVETRPGKGACEAPTFPWAPGWPGELKEVAAAARRHGLSLWLAGPRLPDGCAVGPVNGSPPPALLDAWRDTVATGEAHALRGYDIPDEPAASELAEVSPYFAKIRATIRARSARPVLVSPYLDAASDVLAPDRLAGNADAFARATGIDVQAWQDSVAVRGTGAAGGSRKALERAAAAFRALAEKLGGKRFATVTELFAGGGLERFEDPLAYTSAPVGRVAEQLAAVPGGTELRLGWLPERHLTRVAGAPPGAARLADGYLALLGRGGRLVGTTRLTPDRAPDKRYAGLGTRSRGDPGSLAAGGWSGWTGPVTLTVELAEAPARAWVALHVLNDPAAGIRVPRHLTITCLDAGERPLWSGELPASPTTTEALVGPPTPLALGCRRLRLALTNDAWTFVGGLEVTAP